MLKIVLSVFTALVALGLFHDPAQAQSRVFVAAQGSDSNPCTFAAPCRTFQHAHDIVANGGEIDVLDPAGYGAVNIIKSISIQGHGFSGITVTGGNAISINAPETAVVNLSGLLIEGSGTGQFGIGLSTAGFVTITNTVVRRFSSGLGLGPRNTTQNAIINVSNTIVSHNVQDGVILQPFDNTQFIAASFYRVEAYGNGQDGIFINGQFMLGQTEMKASVFDCIAFGNGFAGGGSGFHTRDIVNLPSVFVKILRSEANQNRSSDINAENASVEVGQTGVSFWTGSITSYGDNYTGLGSPGGILSRH